MSHNPTYDPEPGYNSYENRSGQSTPRQYYDSSPAPAALDSYNNSNMASYRQATTAPPGASYRQATTGPPSADPTGNGKSYRYATGDTIPEDEDETDNAADSKQVQFSHSEPTSKGSFKGKSSSFDGGAGGLKFKIAAGLAVLFALLWVIFLALYISEVTGGDTATGGVDSTENPKPGDTNEATTSKVTTVATQGPVTVTQAPTAAPIPRDSLGTYDGQEVYRYNLTNGNGVSVELLSLGARVNRFVATNNVDVVAGFNTMFPNGTNFAAIADSDFGALDGPVCGVNSNEFHKMHFDGDHTDGAVKFTKTIAGAITLEITYTLSEENELRVVTKGMPLGTSNIDVCNTMRFKLVANADITNTELMIYAPKVLGTNGLSNHGSTGIYGFSSKRSFAQPIQLFETALPDDATMQKDYVLAGPSGLRKAAELSANNGVRVTISTNQEALRLFVQIKPLASPIRGKADYSAKSFVGLTTFSIVDDPSNPDARNERLELKRGSTYEAVTVYTIT